MDDPIIVGVDPGNTSAVAALDLEGELILLESRREFSTGEIIFEIIEAGKPVVVACDTEKMPSTVEKIASSVGAKRFEPEEDLDSERKQELGEGDNSHEVDATASAVHAFNSLRKRIDKIRERAEEAEKKAEIAEDYFEK